MPIGKLTAGPNQEDENWERLNSFPRQEVKEDIFEAIPTKFHHNFTIQNTYFSSSCVGGCSKVVILLSVLFVLLESFLFGLIVYSSYGNIGMLIASSLLFVILIAGGRYRIIWSVSWWRSLRQSDAECHRVYEGTINWTRSMTYLMLFLILPIWIVTSVYAAVFEKTFPDQLDEFLESGGILFVLTAGIDVFVFMPFCACPTAIYAACFWKRVVTEQDRVQNLEERAQNLEEMME